MCRGEGIIRCAEVRYDQVCRGEGMIRYAEVRV